MNQTGNNLCFNSLRIDADSDVIERLLQHAFSDSDVDDWGMSPQGFRFEPFFASLASATGRSPGSAEGIWTNWLEVEEGDDLHQLTIEFESDENPPMSAFNALGGWLKSHDLHFDLLLRYRQENEQWDGEIRDSHHG